MGVIQPFQDWAGLGCLTQGSSSEPDWPTSQPVGLRVILKESSTVFSLPEKYFKTRGVIGRRKTPWTGDTTTWRTGSGQTAERTKIFMKAIHTAGRNFSHGTNVSRLHYPES